MICFINNCNGSQLMGSIDNHNNKCAQVTMWCTNQKLFLLPDIVMISFGGSETKLMYFPLLFPTFS